MPDVASLQLLVPAAEPLLDAVRERPGVGMLDPAHVSLGYPWCLAEEADETRARAAAASVPPFTLRFSAVGTFDPDLRGRVVVRVLPDDDAPVRALAAAVGGDLRDTHLSVARVLPGGDVQGVLDAVAPLLPLEAEVTVLELTVQRDRVWQPGVRLPLGGPALSR